jgi:hypothetical protein
MYKPGERPADLKKVEVAEENMEVPEDAAS